MPCNCLCDIKRFNIMDFAVCDIIKKGMDGTTSAKYSITNVRFMKTVC